MNLFNKNQESLPENKDEKPVAINPVNDETAISENAALSILSQPDEKEKSKRGRKLKTDANDKKKNEQVDKEIDKILKLSMANTFTQISKLIAYAVNDAAWVATEDESTVIGASIVDYLNIRFPKWHTQAPEITLMSAFMLYIIPRVKKPKK